MRERVPTEGSRPGTGANLPLDVTGGAEFAAGV